VWKTHEEAYKNEKLSPAERAAWDPHLLGRDPEAVTQRLLRDVRKLKKRKRAK
jgi:hypothetical protein